MNKRLFFFALALFNAAIFVVATLFLPSAGSFVSEGPLSHYINSRTDWHIAFGVLIASLLISWGVYLTVIAFRESNQGDQ